MTLCGDLHLIERLDHVARLPDGTWLSGYWELTEAERQAVRRVYLHRSKAEPAHFGGAVLRVLPASEFAEWAARHETDSADRWVLILQPDRDAKGVAWQGASHVMAYKSLV